jgi:hypothetical protein|uniref:hypothetical protein n=1 Tax=Prosthecobacter sp. TaxID=1965333 RepID=UPI0037830820
MKDSNQRALWHALSVLGDWFHRLGGAATYPGFHESDIPLYIVIALSEHLGIPLSINAEIVDDRFKQAAASVLPKVKEHIAQVSGAPEDCLAALFNFVEYADQKVRGLRDADSKAWRLVVAAVMEKMPAI